MSFVKTQLKAARNAIGDKNFEYCIEVCHQILENDAENYNALVFLGISLLETDQVEKSKAQYTKAIALNNNNILAYNGLLKLYERVQDVENQIGTLTEMRQLYARLNDPAKYTESLEQSLELSNKVESKALRKALLRECLPTAPNFTLILNPKNQIEIWLEIHEISQSEFQSWVKQQVQARKTRLGAGPLQAVQEQVEAEMVARSDLDEVYESLLPLKLESSEKEIVYSAAIDFYWMKLRYGSDKKNQLGKLGKLIMKCVGDGIPCKLAWILSIEFEDSSLEHRNLSMFRNLSFLEEFNSLVESIYRMTEENVDLNVVLGDVMEALELAPKSIFGHQILVQIYSMQEDWQNVLKSSQLLNGHIVSMENETGLSLPKAKLDATLQLARANFKTQDTAEALNLYRIVLEHFNNNAEALYGMGLVLLEIKQYKEAIEYFETIMKLEPERNEAKGDYGWALFLNGQVEVAFEIIKSVHEMAESYVTNFRMARVYWELGKEYKDDKKYCHSHLIKAIQLNPHYSEAFTYLGHYYLMQENDHERAAKCYSKAYSTNPNDAESVQGLVSIWLKSNRTSEAKVLLDQFAETNPRSSYVWKQLGLLGLHSGQYQHAITNFQASLRIYSMDHLCWISLAEAYMNSGKYVASLKSVTRALEIEPTSLAATYLRGKINHKLSRFEQGYEDLESLSRNGCGLPIKVSLMELLQDYAMELFDNGAFGASLEKFRLALQVGLRLLSERNCFVHFLLGNILNQVYLLLPYLVDQEFKSALSDAWPILKVVYSDELDSFANVTPQSESLEELLFTASFCFYLALKLNRSGKSNPTTGKLLGNIANCAYNCYVESRNENYLALSQRYCKSALCVDKRNPELWNIYGILNVKSDPHIAQHAFIQACELDENVLLTN